MKEFGLIGYPLGHSFSKKYFTEKFEKEGIVDCHYELFPIPSITGLPHLLADHPGLVGLNVTIPYKQQVIPFLHHSEAIPAAVGACNCIKIIDGQLWGFNTDIVGFQKSFSTLLQPHHTSALVLGNGGAAAAVIFVLGQMGIAYKTVSRQPQNALQLSYKDLTPALLADYSIIINTTPLGTYPNVQECPALPYEAISSRHYLFDLVYNPEKTLFLQKGEAQGAIIQNGYPMLVQQAEEAWRIWNK